MSYTLKYEILSENTCEVDKLEGETTEVVIPEYYETDGKKYKVTEIGCAAFFERKTLTSVVLPNSIKKIHVMAFCDCHNLTHMKLPDGLEYIGDHAFFHCLIYMTALRKYQ